MFSDSEHLVPDEPPLHNPRRSRMHETLSCRAKSPWTARTSIREAFGPSLLFMHGAAINAPRAIVTRSEFHAGRLLANGVQIVYLGAPVDTRARAACSLEVPVRTPSTRAICERVSPSECDAAMLQTS
ncbi:hypothetical protein EVAR_31514_1 [Eumeta japonica]|uniref:Uncharacterized protein n=1 Tax=Eumeta variegata TaxID=151549 RepID=A0A4C1Z1T5_EUMVA|nr:hypothetical protein EVAR_31514_1 [Eumeta japonica]